jgi:short-subunit dehydrogenase
LFETNLFGAMQLTRRMLPLLHQFVIANNQKARIINVSSIGGVFGLPWEAAYHASKFAVIGFSQSLRYELAPLKISVCCFVPGGMKTSIFQKSIAESKTEIQNNGSPHFSFYRKNLLHMNAVMRNFQKSSATPQQGAKAISRLLQKNKMPLRKYFGADAKFIGILMWLGLADLLKNQFVVK